MGLFWEIYHALAAPGCPGPATRTARRGASRDRAGWPGWRDRARP
jgi:hypothetical protein